MIAQLAFWAIALVPTYCFFRWGRCASTGDPFGTFVLRAFAAFAYLVVNLVLALVYATSPSLHHSHGGLEAIGDVFEACFLAVVFTFLLIGVAYARNVGDRKTRNIRSRGL